MSIEARLFGDWDGRFHDNETGGGYGPGVYGEALADALLAGTETIEMPDRTVMKVNYLLQMLRITGRTGEFRDELQGAEWDDNTPTLEGADGVRKMRDAARSLRDVVDRVPSGLSDVADCVVLQTRDAVDLLFAEAANLDRTRPAAGVRGPLASRFTLPKVRVRDRRNGADAIWYAEERDTFNFGAYEVSPQKLGRIVALTLMKGEEWICIGDDETEARCGYVWEVTVNYVVEMMREVGLYGSFTDIDDDEFDPNVPLHRGE